jgi:hypothetical protein
VTSARHADRDTSHPPGDVIIIFPLSGGARLSSLHLRPGRVLSDRLKLLKKIDKISQRPVPPLDPPEG